MRTTLPQMVRMQVHSWQAHRNSQWLSSVSKPATNGTNRDIGNEEAFVEKANILRFCRLPTASSGRQAGTRLPRKRSPGIDLLSCLRALSREVGASMPQRAALRRGKETKSQLHRTSLAATIPSIPFVASLFSLCLNQRPVHTFGYLAGKRFRHWLRSRSALLVSEGFHFTSDIPRRDFVQLRVTRCRIAQEYYP